MSTWIFCGKKWGDVWNEIAHPGVQIEVRHGEDAEQYASMTGALRNEPEPRVIAGKTERYLIGDVSCASYTGDDGDIFDEEDVIVRYRVLVDEEELKR